MRPMDRLLELLLRRFVRRGNLRFTTARGSVFHRRRRHRPAGGDPFHDQGRRARRAARSRAQARRSLHGRHAAWWRKARSPTCSRSCSARPPTACRRAGRACNGAALFLPAAAAVQSGRRARGATSRITTISTAGSIRCSSTPTGNTRCAYFETPDQSLDDAQLAKKRHLAAKLPARTTASRVLDIGCGWGGLALYLAEICGARRHRHHAVARAMAARAASARPKRT